jgi:transposase-like protein
MGDEVTPVGAWSAGGDPLAFDPAEFGQAVSAEEAAHPNAVRYGHETGAEIVRRTAAGESLLSICRDEGMPLANTVCDWLKARPTFAAAMEAARVAAGGPFRGRRPLWCHETAQAIYDRVCGGEAATRICAEAGMPSFSTYANWRRQHPEFAEAMDEAQEIRSEVLFEKSLEAAWAVTPETAYAAHVKLAHTRWSLGKLGPRRYGPVKAMTPPPPREEVKVVIRAFDVEKDEKGWQRVVENVPDLETGEVTRRPLGPFKPARRVE